MDTMEGRRGPNVPPAFEDEFGFAFRPDTRAPTEWEARQMITERDRIAVMVGHLHDFARECRNESVVLMSVAAELPMLTAGRDDALALSKAWRDRERLLRDVAVVLGGLASSLVRAQARQSCGCGTGADYRFDPDCQHHSGLRAAAKARLRGMETL